MKHLAIVLLMVFALARCDHGVPSKMKRSFSDYVDTWNWINKPEYAKEHKGFWGGGYSPFGAFERIFDLIDNIFKLINWGEKGDVKPSLPTLPLVSIDETAPEQIAGKFEGDIDLPAGFNPTHRNGLANKGLLWPGGVVYYKISDSFTQPVKSTILAAMQEVMEATRVGSNTCIRFRERRSHIDYLHILRLSGCYSSVGNTGNDQKLSLGRGCERKGTIMHELLHAIGFYHEHSRNDRDDYITINYENVKPGQDHNFQKHALGTKIDHLNQPYDYGSIMHYSPLAFSRDGKSPTITLKQKGVTIGQRKALSAVDIRMIQLLYGCAVSPDDSCDFNADFCGWNNVLVENNWIRQKGWVRHSGSTRTYGTGPNEDFGKGGHYIYVEASRNSYKVARLVSSKTYSPDEPMCLQFACHMFGRNTGTLKIVARGDNFDLSLAQLQGDKGNFWFPNKVDITVPQISFKLMFEAVVGSGPQSDIAIDNVSVTSGKCPK